MQIDFHSHILPGIDDGIQTLEDAIILARQSVDDGVTHILATPHGFSENLGKVLARRDELLASLQSELRKNNLPLTVIPGLEYRADGHSASSALEQENCRCGFPDHDGRPMLVELPFSLDISFAANLLFNAQLRGVSLVLAHPERYDGFLKNRDMLIELANRGLFLQFNTQGLKKSLFSHAIAKNILAIIKECPDQILIGSDSHDIKHRNGGLAIARKTITEALGNDTWHKISVSTPAKLLGLKF